ncbi:tyrosine-type recombinase/integrase [Natrialbaceae archaeon A-chndr2]
MTTPNMNTGELEGITLVPEPTTEYVNPRQFEDYRMFRKNLLQWMYHLGKDPDRAEGYAYETVRQRAYKLDKFYRWVWETEDGYTLSITTEHADQYIKHLIYEDTSQILKAGVQKALKTLFKYYRYEKGRDVEWEPEISFTASSSTHQIKDFLSSEERRKLKQAVLKHGSIPHYNSLTPEERDKWKAHLAQRFEKPKSKVSKKDWDRANGWKYPSIIYTTMDAGFRPIEVGRAKTSWIDLENQLLRIPKEESTKNTENWHVALSEQSCNMLHHWLQERENREKYQDTDILWLTKYGNPYSSSSLNRFLKKLCETAEIPVENRSLTWYSIRHSVGTQMSRDQGPAAVQQQLRQKSYEMAIRYDQAPVDDRQKTVNNWD